MNKLRALGELTVGYGYTTSKNRITLGLPKDHWIDAAVCASNGNTVKVDPRLKPLIIKAVGRGSRQFCSMDKYGFPRTKAKPRISLVLRQEIWLRLLSQKVLKLKYLQVPI